MPHTDTIPVSASIASTGPGIRYIGDYAYAYSGVIASATSSVETLLSFTSGSGFIVGEIAFTETERAAEAVRFNVEFNDIEIITVEYDHSPPQDNPAPYPILIPPFTKVVATWRTGGSANGTGWIVGRVYGAE